YGEARPSRRMETSIVPASTLRDARLRRAPQDDGSESARERSLDSLRFARDHHQIGAHRTVRLRSTLFPIAHARRGKTKVMSKLILRHLEPVSQGPHVNILGHVNTIGGEIRFSPCEGERFTRA